MHPIMAASFAQIDAEFGPHNLTPQEYAVIRRIIHSTADFDFRELVQFLPGIQEGEPGLEPGLETGLARASEQASTTPRPPTSPAHGIAAGCAALRQGLPIIIDVTMVERGVASMVQRTFQNPLISAVAQAEQALPGKTRTETGLLRCLEQYPQAVYVIGNAPTALLALCEQIRQGNAQPALVVGAPVGFISVVESKAALAQLSQTPQIRVEGRKGGSPVAAAIVNALLVLASL